MGLFNSVLSLPKLFLHPFQAGSSNEDDASQFTYLKQWQSELQIKADQLQLMELNLRLKQEQLTTLAQRKERVSNQVRNAPERLINDVGLPTAQAVLQQQQNQLCLQQLGLEEQNATLSQQQACHRQAELELSTKLDLYNQKQQEMQTQRDNLAAREAKLRQQEIDLEAKCGSIQAQQADLSKQWVQFQESQTNAQQKHSALQNDLSQKELALVERQFLLSGQSKDLTHQRVLLQAQVLKLQQQQLHVEYQHSVLVEMQVQLDLKQQKLASEQHQLRQHWALIDEAIKVKSRPKQNSVYQERPLQVPNLPEDWNAQDIPTTPVKQKANIKGPSDSSQQQQLMKGMDVVDVLALKTVWGKFSHYLGTKNASRAYPVSKLSAI